MKVPTCMRLVVLVSVLRFQGTFLDFAGTFFSFSGVTLVVEYVFDAEVSVFMRLRSYISVHLCFCKVQKRSSMGKHIFLVLKS